MSIQTNTRPNYLSFNSFFVIGAFVTQMHQPKKEAFERQIIRSKQRRDFFVLKHKDMMLYVAWFQNKSCLL